MPGARCTRGLVCKVAQRNAHTSIQVQRRQSGIPCAMALRLMPCSLRRRIRLVTVAAGLMADTNPVGSYQPPTAWHQQRVSGPHGFAVRFGVVRPARRLIAHERLALSGTATWGGQRRACAVPFAQTTKEGRRSTDATVAGFVEETAPRH